MIAHRLASFEQVQVPYMEQVEYANSYSNFIADWANGHEAAGKTCRQYHRIIWLLLLHSLLLCTGSCFTPPDLCRKEEWRVFDHHVLARHRQTPETKHVDENTPRGLLHVARSSYSALSQILPIFAKASYADFAYAARVSLRTPHLSSLLGLAVGDESPSLPLRTRQARPFRVGSRPFLMTRPISVFQSTVRRSP